MKSFEWIQPETVDDAVAALGQAGAMPLAGGVDLLDRLKERLESPSRLVSLRKLPGWGEIKLDAAGARIGANVTLARLATDPELRRAHPILAEAAGHAATPQLRAMATLGGNLAQRPRCWYYRSEDFACRKKGGTECFAQTGDAELHAIFGNGVCAAPHPSTIATALVALGARVSIAGAGKKVREVELARFFMAPEQDLRREVDLGPGELITGVTVPAAPAGRRAAYTKQVAKQSFDWPIVDVAVALVMDGRTCKQATIVLGAVAPTPRRAAEAERVLAGAAVDVMAAGRAARAAIAGATPLPGNDHKVPILEAVVARTILAAAAGTPAGSKP
jgi:xanthine dehydrogenase YagS FAD-binding subunit